MCCATRTIGCALSLVTCGCGSGDPEVYLLPDGFTGAAIVAFEQQEGNPVERSGDTMIYRIPESGIHRSAGRFPGMRPSWDFYWVDDEGKRTPIPYRYPDSTLPDSVTQIVRLVSGPLGELTDAPADTLFYCNAVPHDPRSPSIQFTVGRYTDKDALWKKRRELIDSVTRPRVGRRRPGCIEVDPDSLRQ